MSIDYIYVILIIIIMLTIIFMIYYGYDYRSSKSKTSSNNSDNSTSSDIEYFSFASTHPSIPVIPFQTIPDLSDFNFNIYNFNEIANKYDTSFKNLSTEINNRDVSQDNIKNIQLYSKLSQNLDNSKKLLDLKNKSNAKIKSKQTYPIDKLIKTIKSKYNSQYLSTFSYDMSKYGILANDQCITVNGLCKEEYCQLPCQDKLYASDSQKFKTERITSDSDAATSMNTTLDKISNKNIYPFNIFKSMVNSNCLTISNDGVTVEPCNLNDIKQQWHISPDENICLLK